MAVKAHTNSATTTRLSQRATAGRYVSRTTVEVLRTTSSTDSTVVRDRPPAADDPERLPGDRADALQDFEELGRDRPLESAGGVVRELPR